jgi:hypothetical protein
MKSKSSKLFFLKMIFFSQFQVKFKKKKKISTFVLGHASTFNFFSTLRGIFSDVSKVALDGCRQVLFHAHRLDALRHPIHPFGGDCGPLGEGAPRVQTLADFDLAWWITLADWTFWIRSSRICEKLINYWTKDFWCSIYK